MECSQRVGPRKKLSTVEQYKNYSHNWSCAKMKVVTPRDEAFPILDALNKNGKVICQEEHQYD